MSESRNPVRSSPLVNIAAVAVIIASVTAVAGITGLMPSAFSKKAELSPALSAGADVAGADATGRLAASAPVCRQCGAIESIRKVHVNGQGTGLGAVAGGVAGAIVGSQFGRGNGKTAMGVVGAAGGAYAGHEIEKNVRSGTTYRVLVRMEDGSSRTIYQSAPPAYGIGERVRVMNGALASRD